MSNLSILHLNQRNAKLRLQVANLCKELMSIKIMLFNIEDKLKEKEILDKDMNLLTLPKNMVTQLSNNTKLNLNNNSTQNALQQLSQLSQHLQSQQNNKKVINN